MMYPCPNQPDHELCPADCESRTACMSAVQRRKIAADPRRIEREDRTCRDCGDTFSTTLANTGSKWTNLCGSCIRDHI